MGRALRDHSNDAVSAHKDFRDWDNEVADWLEREFPGSGFSAEWSAMAPSPLVVGGTIFNDYVDWINFYRVIDQRQKSLARIPNKVASYKRLSKFREGEKVSSPDNRKVFVVHGHSNDHKESVARFLECLDLEPIILHERANEGQTLIEKFEKNADVGFAVILLSGDDRGGTRETPFEEQETRARQNVILELGFFWGRLGRNQVCPLLGKGVSKPSDFDGVGYVALDDAGAWKNELAREIDAAGIEIDEGLLAAALTGKKKRR